MKIVRGCRENRRASPSPHARRYGAGVRAARRCGCGRNSPTFRRRRFRASHNRRTGDAFRKHFHRAMRLLFWLSPARFGTLAWRYQQHKLLFETRRPTIEVADELRGPAFRMQSPDDRRYDHQFDAGASATSYLGASLATRWLNGNDWSSAPSCDLSSSPISPGAGRHRHSTTPFARTMGNPMIDGSFCDFAAGGRLWSATSEDTGDDVAVTRRRIARRHGISDTRRGQVSSPTSAVHVAERRQTRSNERARRGIRPSTAPRQGPPQEPAMLEEASINSNCFHGRKTWHPRLGFRRCWLSTPRLRTNTARIFARPRRRLIIGHSWLFWSKTYAGGSTNCPTAMFGFQRFSQLRPAIHSARISLPHRHTRRIPCFAISCADDITEETR